MTTCFIFPKQLDDEQWLSLRLDANGQVDAPLSERSVSELHALQVNARTMMVLSTSHAGLHVLELPWLGERKARAVIPYALEEQLAQPVETLHFAFDKQHHRQQHYLIAVIDRGYLESWIRRFNTLHLHFDLITLDWFSLHEHETCVTETDLLVYDDSLKGALSGELATFYLSQQQTASRPTMVFPDSLSSLKPSHVTSIDHSFFVWMAQRLLVTHPMNLCQGLLQHDTRQKTCQNWYKALLILMCVWVVSDLFLKGFYVKALKAETATYDQKIAQIYREFFPKATRILSPRFRIEQLMKGNPSGSLVLWTLLDHLGSAYLKIPFKIEQMRFQNQKMSVTLLSKDFSALEKLQKRLEQASVTVSQSQASSQKNQVIATLELSL